MAALANGIPVLTTLGELSEPIWWNGAVEAVPAGSWDQLCERALDLLGRPERLSSLGAAGRQLYRDRFAIEHTLAVLVDRTTVTPS
jgi:hypothetical protein